MNSIGKVLTNFEWDYDGPISIIRGTGYQGKGVSRTLFLSPKIEDIPERLFAVKVSQSSDPAKAGKLVFKYFSYRFNADSKFSNVAPADTTMETELSALKASIIAKFSAMEGVEYSVNISLPGKFTNVACADDTYAIYDEEKFANPDPTKSGDAPYYIKNDAIIHVHLKGAESQNNEYMQSTLSTTATADEIFQKVQAGKVWGDSSASAAAPVETPAQTGQAVW